jgi:cobalt-zinc-cadmium efflux system protein
VAAPPRRWSTGEPAAAKMGPMTEANERRTRRVLWVALGANAAFLVVEIVGGLAFSSLALLADATHLATDVIGLGVALGAQMLMTRPTSERRTFGFRRAEALGAQANAVLVLAVAVWIAVEAVGRLGSDHQVDGAGLTAVAALGLVLNGGIAVLLVRLAERNLNVRAVVVHVGADVASSGAALLAGIGILIFDAVWLDPVASLVISVLIAWSAWGLLRDTTNVLLEAAPRDVKVHDVEQMLSSEPGVMEVHHLHVWEVASDLPALSAHIVLDGAPSLHDAQVRGEELKARLMQQFGIAHATLELECHECDTPQHSEP